MGAILAWVCLVVGLGRPRVVMVWREGVVGYLLRYYRLCRLGITDAVAR